ncbi:Flp family type IVb pilin [Vibrio breoganii]|uniref:Flp family type IVb pilin n=1 Tax=Vibrio breoganii TaxID=553239 RepID=UPI000CC8FC63|nr:fimbrial protein [Vibrio breoganii]
MKGVLSFFCDEEGLTVVEYVLGAALLVVALTAVFTALESGLKESLSDTIEFANSRQS